MNQFHCVWGFLTYLEMLQSCIRGDSRTLTTSKHRHRIVSGSKYSRSLPPAGYASTFRRYRLSGSKCSRSLPPGGYASRHRHRKVSGSRYSHSLPRVYVVSKPWILHCLLAVSPSSYDCSRYKTTEAYPEQQLVLGLLWPSQRGRAEGLRSCRAYWYDGVF